MKLTYTSYLKIDELLELQKVQSKPEEHDEMLFIIIHQTYELWFKQVLHELNKLGNELSNGNTWSSIKTMRRVLTIMKTLVSQVDILETMTPLEFNSFRTFLGQSSGFQSLQFRELEITCGIHTDIMLQGHELYPGKVGMLEKRMSELTLWERFCEYLTIRGFSASPIRSASNGLIFEPSEKVQKALLNAMKNDPEAALICELLVDFDEGLQEWRYRHVKMVERTIGTKRGTGGSDGAKYLRSTTNNPIFPDLWAIRSQF